MPTAKPTAAELAEWVRRGLIPPDATAPPAEPRPELVAAAFVAPATWVIPAHAPSLANERQWQARNRIAQAHRKAVSRALGPHLRALAPFAERLHSGQPVRASLTRLGGRQLDKHDNLPASLKYVLDAVCLMLGVDDANELLDVKHGQEPGGACGARITLESA